MRSLSKILKEGCIRVGEPSQVKYEISAAQEQCEREASSPPGVGNAVGSVISAANRQSENIIRNAAQEANRTLTAAIAKAEKMEKAGFECGFKQGLADGSRQAAEEKEAAVSRLSEACAQVTASLDEEKQALLEQAMDMAFQLAEKIVNSRLDRDDTAFLPMLENAASRLKVDDKKLLKVGPREYTVAEKYADLIRANIRGMADFDLEQGEENGSLIITSASGSVDAGIKTQICRARRLAGSNE